jgi:hypothetical protein
MSKKRLLSADLLKAISIIGVVFIHGATMFGCKSMFSIYMSNIFRCGVPCFIIMWAYFFEKSYSSKNKDERFKYLKKRFTHLFRVFLIWSLVYFFILVNWQTLTPIKVISIHFSGYGWAGQYYFIVLFQLVLLYPLIRFCYLKKIIRYIVIVSSIVLYVIFAYLYSYLPGFIGKLGDRPFVFWILYVFAGIAFARQEFIKVPLFFLFLIVFIPIEYYMLDLFKLEHSSYILPSVLINSIIIGAIIFQTSLKVKFVIFCKSINYMGKGVMTIFVANPLVIILIKKILPVSFAECTLFSKLLFPFISIFIIVLYVY